MTTYEFASKRIQQVEIDKVLSGVSCGGERIPRPSFPSDAQSQLSLCHNAGFISAFAISQNRICLSTGSQRTALILKLIRYIISVHLLRRDLPVRDIEAIARGIARQPDWFLNSGIAALIRRNRQKAPKSRDIPRMHPPRLAHEADGLRLYELSHPNHLFAESVLTGNCIGHTYDEQVAVQHGCEADDPRYLTYWRRITSGTSRIFSVRLVADGEGVATIEYDPRRRHILDLCFTQRVEPIRRKTLTFLTAAFKADNVPLTSIHIPRHMHRYGAIDADGNWGPFKTLQQDRIIGGVVEAYPEADALVLSRYLATPGLHVTFGKSCNPLMPHLTGSIACNTVHSRTTIWPEAITEVHSSGVYFGSVECARFTSLTRIYKSSVYLNELREGEFPALKTVSHALYAGSLECSHFPVLEGAGCLRVPDIARKAIRLLKRGGTSRNTVCSPSPKNSPDDDYAGGE